MDKKTKTRGKLVLEAIKEWLKCSSLHGFPNFVRNKDHTEIRLLWIVCILAASSYGALTITNSLITFFQYELKTVVSLEKLPSIEFPTVKYKLNIFK